MNTEYQVVKVEKPTDEMWEVIGWGINFQAPKFYEQHGYRVFGELNDFPSGHQRYYMTKKLEAHV